MFLTNAFKIEQPDEGFSPYLLGGIGGEEIGGEEDILDIERLDFLRTFLHLPFEKQYNEAQGEKEKERIKKFSIHLELMVYTHSWESISNLKKLKHLVNLIESKEYDWELKIPKKSKKNYITSEIRDVFQKHNLKIADVITMSYQSQLRNAFAHSQYSFGSDNIYLHNYERKSPQKKNLTFNNWEDIFIKTVLLFFIILRKKKEYRRSIGIEKGEVEIYEPYKKKGYDKRILVYIENSNSFIDKANLKSSSI
ncbi:hypothetical protein KAW48_07830 [candidate division WOR-3 bacterium]|nr:hypothetical protein [candidate division WOR-3 bacterium]